MKDINEQLKEALSQIVLGEDAEGNTYHFGDEDGSEMQQGIELITALINDNYVPKEFVEWMGLNTITDKIGKQEIRYLITDLDCQLTWITIDELFEYWKENIKAKQ